MLQASKTKALAQAKSIILGFESVHCDAATEGVDITRIGWVGFRDRMLTPFTEGSTLRHLAWYALSDARQLIERIQTSIPADTHAEARRQLLHANVEHITGPPAGMTDDGKNQFLDTMGDDDALYAPATSPDGTGLLFWGRFDFEYFTSSHTGCPALEFEPSEKFPMPDVEQTDVLVPANFLYQFFHVAIDAAFNDPNFMSQA